MTETLMNRKYAVTQHVDVLVDVVVEAESKDQALQKVKGASAEGVVVRFLDLPEFVVPTYESTVEQEVVDLDPLARTVTIDGITFAIYPG
jgi:hypothetical protein